MTKYPEMISEEHIEKSKHISDSTIRRDILDTQREIKHLEIELNTRYKFVEFLQKLIKTRNNRK